MKLVVKSMEEYKVNEYITLKLEDDGVILYVAGWGMSILNETAQPEAEFRGFCLKFQAWADNDYDPGFLAPDRALPLLERLFKVGDPLAIKAFKETLAIKLENENEPYRSFLLDINNHFLYVLDSNILNMFLFDEGGYFKPFFLDLLDISEVFSSKIKTIFTRRLHFLDEERWALVGLFLKSSDPYFLQDIDFREMPLTSSERESCEALETLSALDKKELRKERLKISEKMREGLKRYFPDPTRDRRYSERHPKLPVYFSGGFEEYVYCGVDRYVSDVQENINENMKETIINRETFKKLADIPDAMEILEKNGIIDDVFIEGAHLYIDYYLESHKFKEKLLTMSETFINDFYAHAIKVFFEKYYKIYRTCPICLNVKEDSVFNKEDKKWFCPDCLRKR